MTTEVRFEKCDDRIAAYMRFVNNWEGSSLLSGFDARWAFGVGTCRMSFVDGSFQVWRFV